MSQSHGCVSSGLPNHFNRRIQTPRTTIDEQSLSFARRFKPVLGGTAVFHSLGSLVIAPYVTPAFRFGIPPLTQILKPAWADWWPWGWLHCALV